MTEAELGEIAARHERGYDILEESLDAADRDVGALVAEVRRLRALVKSLEWGSCDGCGISDVCTECKAHKSDIDPDTWKPIGHHKPDCPAFTPEGEVK